MRWGIWDETVRNRRGNAVMTIPGRQKDNDTTATVTVTRNGTGWLTFLGGL